MKAGTELDLLVAQAVLGITYLCSPNKYGVFLEKKWGSNELAPCWKHVGGSRWDFNPSTNMEAAWVLVDFLRERMCCLEIDFGHNFVSAQFITAGEVDESHPMFDAKADTAAVAICLAALKACGYEEKV